MKEARNFEGFLPETIDFMWELRFNNNKEWLDANRDKYKSHLKEPMDRFAEELKEEMLKFNSKWNLVYNISRINRDIRFSKNKAPYKEQRWVSYRQAGTQGGKTPEFYFEITPEGYSYGMGFYENNPAIMQRFRKKIDANTSELEGLIHRFKNQKEFILVGENYKRKLAADKSEEVLEWYQKKCISFIAKKEIEQCLFSREILQKVKEGFQFLIPYYEYLLTIV